jgi:hypothetical protein
MTIADTATPSADTAAPATYCENVLALLNLLARAAPGELILDFFGTPERGDVKCSTGARLTVLPTPVLAALEADWHVRVVPALTSDASGRVPVSVAALYARFRPPVSFDAKAGRHVAEPDAAKIRDALAGFLPAALIVDALGEVTAWWPLREPLRDMVCARDLQRRLAERLGAATETDVEMAPPPRIIGPGFARMSHMLPADAPAAFVSIAGKCRDAGAFGPWVSIDVLDAARTYDVEEIAAALARPNTITTEPDAETTSRRKGARA